MIKGDEMNRSEKRLKVTKNDVLRFYTPSQTFLNDFACMFKEIFRFLEIFRIPLKAASNFTLRWTPSQTISRSFFEKFKVCTYRAVLDIYFYI